MRHGDTLKNGAKVVAFMSGPCGSTVIADSVGLSAHKFCVWTVGAKNETFNGFYTDDYSDALSEFERRGKLFRRYDHAA